MRAVTAASQRLSWVGVVKGSDMWRSMWARRMMAPRHRMSGLSAAQTGQGELKALCRACPRRWLCAKEALETPGAQGMWSGVHIPEYGRGRTFAIRQLRSLAAHGGQRLRK